MNTSVEFQDSINESSESHAKLYDLNWKTGDPLFENYMALLLTLVYDLEIDKSLEVMGVKLVGEKRQYIKRNTPEEKKQSEIEQRKYHQKCYRQRHKEEIKARRRERKQCEGQKTIQDFGINI